MGWQVAKDFEICYNRTIEDWPTATVTKLKKVQGNSIKEDIQSLIIRIDKEEKRGNNLAKAVKRQYLGLSEQIYKTQAEGVITLRTSSRLLLDEDEEQHDYEKHVFIGVLEDTDTKNRMKEVYQILWERKN